EQQAVDLLTRGAARALDVAREDPRLVDRYDTSMFSCGKKVFQPSVLGRQMLLARRLVEAGAGFVTVQSAGWDMHADVNNPRTKPAPSTDPYSAPSLWATVMQALYDGPAQRVARGWPANLVKLVENGRPIEPLF